MNRSAAPTTETTVDATALRDAVRAALLRERCDRGHWLGELSSSALSTATAVTALEIVGRESGRSHTALVNAGRDWLARTQNEDGGFGDTEESPSNVSTSTLCWAALAMTEESRASHSSTLDRLDAYLEKEIGELTAGNIATVISERYGIDKTFSVPILTMCALSGRFGEGPRAWAGFPTLPFELAALPHQLFAVLGLPVVSYALPALIAIGQAQHRYRPTRNPFARLARTLTRNRTLKVLTRIQPESGGFLEATPLTSFVTMSLAGAGNVDHPVAKRAVEFLVASAREDGSWPIDTDLCTWVTTLSVKALHGGGQLENTLSSDERKTILGWILGQQTRTEHPYTHAAPGAWAWTDLSGGVPDADDTPGALLALHHLAEKDGDGKVRDAEVRDRAGEGVRWLLDLQNRDGGIPTFCKGWGKLPFDQSSPDLTAHTLLAWDAWKEDLAPSLRERTAKAVVRGVDYLLDQQRDDGAWVPLWFGNQAEARQENPLYGTSRVLRVSPSAVHDSGQRAHWMAARERGVRWLLEAQGSSGGFGGGQGLAPTIEETGLAVEALASCLEEGISPALEAPVRDDVSRAVTWIDRITRGGTAFPASPIGLYFAKLWYHEKLYPLVFSLAGLERTVAVLREKETES